MPDSGDVASEASVLLSRENVDLSIIIPGEIPGSKSEGEDPLGIFGGGTAKPPIGLKKMFPARSSKDFTTRPQNCLARARIRPTVLPHRMPIYSNRQI